VTPRGRLFRKYVIVFAGLVSGALLASGAIEIYFSYQENRAALVALQREKALGVASRIEDFIKEIERQIGWTTQPQLGAPAAAMYQRRVDYLRLLRQVLAITEISHLDTEGKEQLRVSRLAMDVTGSGIDFSHEPEFIEAKAGKVYHGPVKFRKESEPYMTIAIAGSGKDAGVTVAAVNLKFIWDVVSQIKIGKAGHAYVVDAQGVLIAHPDISLVLQKTTFATLEQVKAALAALPAGPADRREQVTIARDLKNRSVMTAYATIAPLRWSVFVEQPLEEAFESLYASIKRTIALVVLGVLLAVAASLVLARRMVTPIQALQAGAARIGAGELEQRIDVRTGDELEALGSQFNSMAAQLKESYAGLERKVDERTRELTESLEQQTATAEILRVISSSPTDVQPVFEAVARSAARFCDARDVVIVRLDGGVLRWVAGVGPFGANSRELEVPVTRAAVIGRAVVDRTTVHIRDLAEESEEEFPVAKALQRRLGLRTMLTTPLLREDAPVGAIALVRTAVQPFTDKQVMLLQTFADQAVIAIENVRLFQELQARTRELARSVGELQALGEVGRAVSSTLDLETVLATIVSRANQLSGSDGGAIYEYDEETETFLLRATQNLDPELVDLLRSTFIHKGEGVMGRIALTREPVQNSDILRDATYQSRVREILLRTGYRAVLAVPLIRESGIIGALVVNRKTPGEFAPDVIELLRTFATQSALAIQNARLFQEIEEKSRQLEIADRHKSEFLASMSHELRTPLNAVIGFSEVLLERMFGEINPKQDEYLQDILSSGRHLLSLINDILDLAKIEAGRMELEVADFHLPQAIDNAVTLVRERAARRAITLEVAIDPQLGEIKGDERKVKQVLLNLLSNAIKFTPEGGRVDVQAGLVDGVAEISVTDTGVGIAPEDHEAVFEEFRQVGTDYAKKHEGTGLGLTLSRRFVELHGGKIWVKSQLGQGATFTFTLPVKPWPTS
jgi:signal transduction histidine kinase/HAMP domain-containing protein